jgi:hypothetical protein
MRPEYHTRPAFSSPNAIHPSRNVPLFTGIPFPAGRLDALMYPEGPDASPWKGEAMRKTKKAAALKELVAKLGRREREAQILCKKVAAAAEVHAEHVEPHEVTEDYVADLGLAVGYLSQALQVLSGMSAEEAATWLAEEVRE